MEDLSFRVDLPISFLSQVRVGNIPLSLGASNSSVEWDVKCPIQPQAYNRSENFHPNLKFMYIFYFSLEERSCLYWPVHMWHRYPDFKAYHGLPHLEDRNTWETMHHRYLLFQFFFHHIISYREIVGVDIIGLCSFITLYDKYSQHSWKTTIKIKQQPWFPLLMEYKAQVLFIIWPTP